MVAGGRVTTAAGRVCRGLRVPRGGAVTGKPPPPVDRVRDVDRGVGRRTTGARDRGLRRAARRRVVHVLRRRRAVCTRPPEPRRRLQQY